MKRLSITLTVTALVMGCSDPSAPEYSPPDFLMEAVSSRLQTGAPGAEVIEAPVVRVFRGREGLAGRDVEFTIIDPSGGKSRVAVTTNSSGIAMMPGWKLGKGVGVYVVHAAIGLSDPIIFRAVIPGRIVAQYELKSTVPAHIMREAHYVFYEGGVYNAFYDTPSRSFSLEDQVFGMYTRNSSRLDFRVELKSLASAPRLVQAGHATINGSELTVMRGDPLADFPVETYVLTAGSL